MCTQIFQAHGDFDPVVPYKFGQLSASLLKSFMKNVSFKTYAGLSHSSCDDEMNDIRVSSNILQIVLSLKNSFCIAGYYCEMGKLI